MPLHLYLIMAETEPQRFVTASTWEFPYNYVLTPSMAMTFAVFARVQDAPRFSEGKI